MEKEKTCCFTGHRQIPVSEIGDLKKKIELKILDLYREGIVYFGNGGALGFDMLAAQCTLELKKTYPQIKLIMVLPCKEQADRWNYNDKVAYFEILHNADKIIYTSEHYTKHCMYIRNRHLVDNSNYCICYLTQKNGGTAFTVSYAIKKKLKIINLANNDFNDILL